jgi:hypothetical protein
VNILSGVECVSRARDSGIVGSAAAVEDLHGSSTVQLVWQMLLPLLLLLPMMAVALAAIA